MICPADAESGDGPFVYFATTSEDCWLPNAVKIGTTGGCPIRRMDQVGREEKLALHLEAVLPFSDARVEANLHRRFSLHRLHGEWFHRCLDIDLFMISHCRDFGPYERSMRQWSNDDFLACMGSRIEEFSISGVASILGLSVNSIKSWNSRIGCPGMAVQRRAVETLFLVDCYGLDAVKKSIGMPID